MRQLVGGSADASLTVLEKQRLERLKTWTAKVEESVILSEEVVSEILQLPAVRKEIGAALESAKAGARQMVEQELRDELEKITAARDQLARLVEERDKLLAELADARRRQELFANTLESAVEARLRTVMEKPQEFLAEHALIRAAISLGTANEAENTDTTSQESADFQNLSVDPEKLIQTLAITFTRRGFRDRLPLALHGSFLAGSVPLLYGVHAQEALCLYSSAVTNGNILWLPMSPSYFEPADVIVGRTGGPQHGFSNPNGLLNLLERAQSSNAMYLVVLEGVNRCFMQSAVEPIFRHAVDRKRGFPIQPLLRMSRGKSRLRRPVSINWPPNVLLAGTIADEHSLYSVPLSTWESAVWIFTDSQYDPAKRDLDGASPTIDCAGFDAHAWSEWEARSKQIPSGDLKVFLRLTGDKLLLSSSFYSTASRLYSIFTQLSPDIESQDLLLDITELTLIPRCMRQLDRLKEILEAAPFELWPKIKGLDILQRLNASAVGETRGSETW